jgi:UDPglucose 6-dehydrogenase
VIAFIGLSHLGINYSLATAAKGFHVIGYDPNEELCENLNKGRFPVSEPGLEDLFKNHQKCVRFTSNLQDLASCELIFTGLDVKTDSGNRSDLEPLNQLIESTLPFLKPSSTLVVLSQVTPGYTRNLSRRIGIKQIYYQVETLIFGRAVERAMKPERFILGCSNPTLPLPQVYGKWLESFQCPVLPMRYESAELAKIAINFFLVSSVSTTNTLAELCEKIGADWSEIESSLRLDARIGTKAYLTPGLGLSGGNLERDLQTFRDMANERGADWRLIQAWDSNSSRRRDWALHLLKQNLPSHQNQQLAIWGLAYKENTHSTKNSPALALIEAIPDFEKRAYDPQVRLETKTYPKFSQVSDPLTACDKADALVIMTPWAEFRDIKLRDVSKAMRGRLILDPFGMLNAKEVQEFGFKYFKLGFGNPLN